MQHAEARKTYYAFTRGDAGWLEQHVEERQIKDDRGVPREARTLLHCAGACGEGDERSSLVVATPSTGRHAPPFHPRPGPGRSRTPCPRPRPRALVGALPRTLACALAPARWRHISPYLPISPLYLPPTCARWHQIRKHLNGLSHPVIGDSRHGDTKVNP